MGSTLAESTVYSGEKLQEAGKKRTAVKNREIKIEVTNITRKQWANFIIELNLIKEAWKSFGPQINITTKDFDKIIKWGKRRHGASEQHEETILESERN